MRRYYAWAVGTVAAVVLLAFYLTLVSLAEGRTAAQAQFRDDLPFLAFLFPSFGAVAGLYAAVREAAAAARASGAMAGTSTGLSATAVVACCAHFLPTLLPLVGISALASILASWKAPLLVIAIVLNVGVAAYLVRHLRRMRKHHGHMA